jgi:LPPG:FO 2-phospho-L-lactate transferase
LAAVLEPADLTVVANTGDDEEFWGLLVCPDVDAVLYRLAGVFNEQAGYGQKDETFHALEMLEKLGERTWFRIGDRDLAVHLLRAEMLRRGATLTETCIELCNRLGVHVRVLPMTDQPVRTRCITERGTFSLQEYFVRERLEPALVAIEFDGMEVALPTSAVLRALGEADLVVIGPSNPLISIDPILKLVGPALPRERTVAVTPLVGGVALKGPTVEMMRALGIEVSPVAVARLYQEFASGFVLDETDQDLAPSIEALGYRVVVGRTVMDDGGRRLAALLLNA